MGGTEGSSDPKCLTASVQKEKTTEALDITEDPRFCGGKAQGICGLARGTDRHGQTQRICGSM